MQRFSQTVKIALALFVAVFANGSLSTVVAAATLPDDTNTNITEVVTPEEVATEPQETIILEEIVSEPQEIVTETEPIAPLALMFTQPENQFMQFEQQQYTPQNILVTPVEPTVTDLCGTNGDTYTIPTVTGVEYWRGNTRLTNGQTYSTYDDSSVTITAKAKSGYIFANNKTSESWRLDFKEKCVICHRTASAGNPYVQIEVDDSAINGQGNGDHYKEHTGPVFPAVGTDGKWGDIIPVLPGVHSGMNWVAGQAIYTNDCVVPVELEVTPGPCAYFDTESWVKIDLSGTAKNTTLVVKDSSGNVLKEWEIKTDNDGNVTSPSLPVTLSGLSAGSYTVEVVLKKDVIASSVFSIDQCYYPVTPQEPRKLDMCYGDKDKIYIKDTEGVVYYVNTVEMSGWVNFEGEALVVTAEAAPGYELDEEAVASWTFDTGTFPNEKCLIITKKGVVASDTNHDGVIGVGDTVTWEITVTNTSDSKCENFYVTLDDDTVVLEDDGYIGYLGAGESVTLAAASTLTVSDFKACKATNTATFFGWRAQKSQDITTSFRVLNGYEDSEPLATGSATAEYTLVCPTPGSGGGTPTTPVVPVTQTLPATIPATGATPGNPLFALLAATIAYGATFFLQRRNLLGVQSDIR